ncbi:MAG: hypothetical protein CL908_12360 [Deltaproteobacteria bacterium]|nr:hypothetical protein [Deltaproteobacteria bacterium]
MQETTRDEALARSAVFSALALAFGPPGPEVQEKLGSDVGSRALSEALCAMGAPALADLAGTLAGSMVDERAYRRLFGHTARGAVPPYETEYGRQALFQQPRELSDIAGFFAAFGLVLDPSRHERPDHVRCECEFLGFLARKEAFALERDDCEMLGEVRKAQRLFLRDHLGAFAPALGEGLRKSDGGGFYGIAGQLLKALCEHECRRADVAPGPETLELRELTSQDTSSISCSEAEGCDAGECG